MCIYTFSKKIIGTLRPICQMMHRKKETTLGYTLGVTGNKSLE